MRYISKNVGLVFTVIGGKVSPSVISQCELWHRLSFWKQNKQVTNQKIMIKTFMVNGHDRDDLSIVNEGLGLFSLWTYIRGEQDPLSIINFDIKCRN